MYSAIKRIILNNSNGKDEGDLFQTESTDPQGSFGVNDIPSTYHNIEQGGDGTYYASFDKTLFKSGNGEDWVVEKVFPTDTKIQAIAIAPSDPDLLYIAFNDPHYGLGSTTRLWRKSSFMGTWEPVPVKMPLPNLPYDYDPTGNQGISDIAFDHNDPNILWLSFQNFGANNDRIYYTTNAQTPMAQSVEFTDADSSKNTTKHAGSSGSDCAFFGGPGNSRNRLRPLVRV